MTQIFPKSHIPYLVLTNIPIIMIFYMTFMAIIQAKDYNKTFKPQYKKFESNPLILLKNMGTFVYLYCGMNSFHQAYTTVRFPTTRRVVKMSFVAVIFIWILGTIFGMTSYFSLGQELKGVSLFPDRRPLPGRNDLPNTILKASKKFQQLESNHELILPIVLFSSLSICYAINVLPLKENLFQAMKVKQPKKSLNLLVTFGIVLLTTTCSWLYKDVTSWLQLVGSFAGVVLAFTIPGKPKI